MPDGNDTKHYAANEDDMGLIGRLREEEPAVVRDTAPSVTLPRAERCRKQPSPSLSNKMARLAWGLVRATLFRFSPIPFYAWRRFLLRAFGGTIAKGARPYPAARIWAPWNLTMEADSVIGPFADIYNVARITLGEKAIVSQKSYLCSAGHDFRDPAFPLITAPITIERDAWVAADAFVGPGVTISEGAVIGARGAATRSLPAGAVVAGNPARIVGWRSEAHKRRAEQAQAAGVSGPGNNTRNSPR